MTDGPDDVVWCARCDNPARNRTTRTGDPPLCGTCQRYEHRTGKARPTRLTARCYDLAARRLDRILGHNA